MELYDYLNDSLRSLHLDGIYIEEKLFVSGKDIRNDKRFLADPYGRPYTKVDPLLIQSFIENPTQSIRHYKCIQVVDWKGELIVSIFLRLLKLNRNLFVEASYFLLTPLREHYHSVDSINLKPTWRQQFGLLLDSSAFMSIMWVLSPLIVYYTISTPLRRWFRRKHIRRLIMEKSDFDYGALASIRGGACDLEYRRYFQKLDKEMYMKILERQILDSIIEFLDRRNIDTSDLKERQTTILNNGVIVSGGSVEVDNLAVGERARTVVTRLAKAAQPSRAMAETICVHLSRCL